MENELFDLVRRAQQGDEEAMSCIIAGFAAAIRSARGKVRRDRRDDVEQSIKETLIKKILTYDLEQTPDFSAFCRQLNAQAGGAHAE